MSYWTDDRGLTLSQRRLDARQQEAVEAAERRLYDSIVHGLRMRGWSRIEAEGEALARIDRMRQKRKA